MQDAPLTLVHFFDRAERLFRDKTVTTATGTGRERITYGEWAERTRRLGGVLDDLGCPTTPASPPSAGTPPATSSSTSRRPAPAGCCTRSTSASSPSS